MQNRDAVLHYQKTLDNVGTLEIDLDITDPISAIWLEARGTNGSTSNKGNFISDVITKIEVVDGSDVLCALRWDEAEALHFYKTGLTPCMFPSEWADGLQRHSVMILFGRHLWDRSYALNPKKYTNPQLKVTSNIAAVRAASATTAFVSASLALSAVAKVMQGAEDPGQFLMQKQINSWTGAASGDKRLDLPVDYPYRMAMMRLYLAEYDINELCTDLKLTCDTDKFIPFNRKVAEMDAEALERFGVTRLKHDMFFSHQDTVRLLHNKEPDCRPFYQSSTTPTILGIDWQWSNAAKFNCYSHAGAADTTDRKYTMAEEGHALHATLPIPFGLMDEPETWFPAPDYKKIELVLTQGGAASGAGSLVLEQVRPQ